MKRSNGLRFMAMAACAILSNASLGISILINFDKLVIYDKRAEDAKAAREIIYTELRDTKIHIMDRIMQEDAGSWHLGMGQDSGT